ncbi:MAG: biotin/lipoate A/B protein ligase family protein [Nitrospirota bacterium]
MSDAWRFIDSGSCSAAYNMAVDEAIATAVRKDKSPPTLRLYGWNIPYVSIGCFQKISDIDIEYCTERHIMVVRRPTGGRAILHNHELTYSFSTKTIQGLFSKGLIDSYKKISMALGSALSKIGLSPELKLLREARNPSATRHSRSPLCFQSTSFGEITINNKKVVGSAQKRWTDCLLQQGSIPFTINKDELARIFRLESTQEVKGAIGLKDIFPRLNTNDLKNTIRISFEETFDTRLISSSPSQGELSLAQELEAQKYLSYQWNFKR